MQKDNDEETKKIISQIEKDVSFLLKHGCDLEKYCSVSQKVLKTPIKYLQDSERQARNKNATINAYYFLHNANVDFVIPRQIEKREQKTTEDRKREQAQREAGNKLLGMIKSAWSYYFRIIKGYLSIPKGQNSPIFNKQTVKMGKEQIQNMLKQLRNSKYHWFNYTTDGLEEKEREKKEMEEEKTFVQLLSNMLKAQSEKVLRSRSKTSQNKQGKLKQSEMEGRQDSPGNPSNVLVQEAAKEKKKVQKEITSVINVSSYFQKRKKQLENPLKPLEDPISQCQSRRQFNAAVLRYCMSEK